MIIGGASILGGRGRVLGSCLGATLVVLIDKVLREGWPITRTIKIGDEEIAVNAGSPCRWARCRCSSACSSSSRC